MLLLQTFMESSFSKAEALTELNLEDVFRILFTSRLVFLSFGAIKSNLSENVLWPQAGFMQNIFIKVLSAGPAAECPGSHADRRNALLMKKSRNKGRKPASLQIELRK